MVDANANRAREGLRVCEDICRFALNAKTETRTFKTLRHRLTACVVDLGIIEMIATRDVGGDTGRKTTRSEQDRENIGDLFFANAQRVKESVRVLEECAKLFRRATAEELKTIRYEVYTCEKKVAAKIARVSNP